MNFKKKCPYPYLGAVDYTSLQEPGLAAFTWNITLSQSHTIFIMKKEEKNYISYSIFS